MGNNFLKYSSYLVSRNSFATGAGQLFDISGSYNIYNDSLSEIEADSKAAACDWLAVGEDMNYAVHEFKLKNYSFFTDEQPQKEKKIKI